MSSEQDLEHDLASRLRIELDGQAGPAPSWAQASVAVRAGRPKSNGRGWLLVAAVVAVGASLLGGVLVAGGRGGGPTTPAGPTAAPTALNSATPPTRVNPRLTTLADQLAALRQRPILTPPVSPGGTCPVTPTAFSAPDLGDFQGTGPVYVSNLQGEDLKTLPFQNGWYGQKVGFAVDAREPGVILVRGKRIDVPADIGLGADNGAELVLTTPTFGPPAVSPASFAHPPTRVFLDGVSLRTPGCYELQLDGPTSTSIVIFEAVESP